MVILQSIVKAHSVALSLNKPYKMYDESGKVIKENIKSIYLPKYGSQSGVFDEEILSERDVSYSVSRNFILCKMIKSSYKKGHFSKSNDTGKIPKNKSNTQEVQL